MFFSGLFYLKAKRWSFSDPALDRAGFQPDQLAGLFHCETASASIDDFFGDAVAETCRPPDNFSISQFHSPSLARNKIKNSC
jgi:hypothetical protein